MLSATPSYAISDAEIRREKIKEIAVHLYKTPQSFSFVNYGLHYVVLDCREYSDYGISIYIFQDRPNPDPEFVLSDFKGNKYGNVDSVDGMFSQRWTFTQEEKKKFNDIYSKMIDKFYSKINKEEPSEGYITFLEKTLKEYYQEKEDMKDLKDIVEKE
ncbi:MAG: hypothetical protein ISS23_03995 [Nanoarchaeota archaeon]|nr:hypothetical protein [Nanoarchaeota archaeon]